MDQYSEIFLKSLAAHAESDRAMQEGLRQNAQLDETKQANQARQKYEGRTADLADKMEASRQAQQDFTDTLTLNNAGATPQVPATMPASGAAPAGMPAPAAAAPAGAGLMDSLGAAGGVAPVAPVAPAPVAPANSGLTVNHGGVTYTLPSLTDQHNAAFAQAMKDDAIKHKAEMDANGILPTPRMVKEWGLDPDQKYDPKQILTRAQIDDQQAQADERDAAAKKPPTPEKKPDLKFESVTNDAGDVVTTGRDPVTGAVVSREVQKGAGGTAAARHPEPEGGRPKAATPGQYAGVEKDKAAALTKSQEELQKELAGVQKSYTEDATFDRAGGIRQAYANHYARQQQAQLTYEARRSELGGADVGHNPWADQAAAAAANQGPAATAAPVPAPVAGRGPTAPKVATTADIDAAVKSSGMSRADTIKAFQAKGWKIGQ